MTAFDEPAAEHPLAVVHHERLPGRDRGHRLVERELDLVAVDADDLRRGGRGAVPHLHTRPARRRAADRRASSRSRATTPRPSNSVARPDHDGAVVGANRDDEHRLAESAGQSATLADREAREAVVRADVRSVQTSTNGPGESAGASAPSRWRMIFV